MSNLTFSENPFDVIRRQDEIGNEYWFATELMPLLGYKKWERFVDALDRARLACQNTGVSVEIHIADAGVYTRGIPSDYRLSRYFCYLAAMNSDPRKSEVAMAQSYFAIKAREAEVRPLVQKQTETTIAPDYVESLLRRSLSRTSLSSEQQELAILRGLGRTFPQLRPATDEAVAIIQETTATLDRHVSPMALGKLYAQKHGFDKEVSAQKINNALLEAGFQYSESVTNSKGEVKKIWHLTEAGKEFGAVLMEVVEGGKNIEKVRWLPDVVDLITVDFSVKKRSK